MFNDLFSHAEQAAQTLITDTLTRFEAISQNSAKNPSNFNENIFFSAARFKFNTRSFLNCEFYARKTDQHVIGSNSREMIFRSGCNKNLQTSKFYSFTKSKIVKGIL